MESMVAKPEELIIVKQLPVIEDRLDEAYSAVQERLDLAASLVVTEENYKELKKTRADLNKEFGDLESLRKKVKEAVESPYKKFESGAYKRLADKYRGAIAELDGNIKDVEGKLRGQRQEELCKYFDEYRQSLGLDSALVSPEKSGIKVGLSGSMKSLKEQVRGFLDRVNGDLAMIDTLDSAEEVLVEYRYSLNVAEAVKIVNERHKKIEEEKKRREVVEKPQVEPEEVSEPGISVVSLRPEVDENQAQETQSNLLSTRYLGYEIWGTLEQLKGLKGYMQEALMEYCEMEGMKYGAC